MRPIICVDFDGVLNSFESGWLSAGRITDPPVEGAISWLRYLLEELSDFQIAIYSARSKYFGGRRGMKRWLMKWGLTKQEIKELDFPLFKPAAFLTIDDRALTFRGKFFSADKIRDFRPWYEKTDETSEVPSIQQEKN
jgi:hypothetical protein